MARRTLALLMSLIGLIEAAGPGCAAPEGTSASAGAREGTSIRVFAAASLSDAFSSASGTVPQVRPTFSFAGSQQLVSQLTQGARADVVATADEASMQRLVDAQLVDPPVPLARTTLVIAVARGNPKGVNGLVDLARPDVALVLADPSVPAGRYAGQVLDRAGVRVRPRSLELDVRAALARVESGLADAAIVYATDVRGGDGKAIAVTFSEAADPAVTIRYRIAVVSATRRRAAAQAFVTAAVAGPVRDALLAAGFAT